MRPSSALLVGVVKLLVGAYARWIGSAPASAQRIYFANHTSHIDTLAIWSALPRGLRRRTRPIAARDYWGKGLRKYLATRGFGAVLIDRVRENPESDPLEPLRASLREGDSLIIFPEGTRGATATPAPFRSGLFRLATEFSGVELIPVYLDNLHRSLPKGALLPVPVVCTVRFGAPLVRINDEAKDSFLARARDAVIQLADPKVAA
jgi:1-acyl-sn-glycerol-3-phosphate acyltransferase